MNPAIAKRDNALQLIKPHLADIAVIDEAVQAFISGQIIDHTERLH